MSRRRRGRRAPQLNCTRKNSTELESRFGDADGDSRRKSNERRDFGEARTHALTNVQMAREECASPGPTTCRTSRTRQNSRTRDTLRRAAECQNSTHRQNATERVRRANSTRRVRAINGKELLRTFEDRCATSRLFYGARAVVIIR